MNSPSFVFRTDASLEIGTGHVMRCLTLADALRVRGANCRFVCREHPGNLLDLIRDRGYETLTLPFDGSASHKSPQAHIAWLCTDWETDSRQTLSVLGDMTVDWLIVDHYALDSSWEHQLRTACCRLMVIDDLADRMHDCDLLLDQNLGRTDADYSRLVPTGCTILAGPKYALLRPEFAALRPYSLARRSEPKLKQLLIAMGGVDKDNATGQILEALKSCALPNDCCIKVVMGKHAPWLPQVSEQATQMPWETEVLVNVGDMEKLMAGSDVAVGAPGSMSWERCCLGLPSIVVVLAENQKHIAKALDFSGAAKLTSMRMLVADLKDFLGMNAFASSMLSYAAANVTSGEGVGIVSQLLFAKENV